ncbi:DUF4489 domain-containing protein [Wukongibacter baidiensis]|uniref:DUF4489 domain-containing protein n=1 Tax=Wukongibacter baidiensis TaxID=1723361 RepID=UPI003D7F4094
MTGHIKKFGCGCDRKKKDCDRECKKKTEPKRIIFECGESVEAANFTIDSSSQETFTLARVFVDSSKLCRPQVKIEFSTQVVFAATPVTDPVNIRMTFTLKRQCGDGPEMTIREWEYINSFDIDNFTFAARSVSEPFTISFCEPLQCPDCCEYFVEVTATPATDFTNIMSAAVNPDNDASMSAFAKGICSDC